MAIERFLIVDDSDANTLFFEVLLKELGYKDPVVARTGIEGLKHLDREHSQFVIAAWEMGPMPGTVFVQRVRKKKGKKFMPFLLFSKRMSPEDVRLTNELGYENILSMPFDRTSAGKLIKDIIQREESLDPLEKALRKMEGYLDENRPSEALKLFDRKLEKDGPFFVKAHWLLGDIWIRLMKYDKAEIILEKALSKEPECYHALRLKSQLYSKTDRHKEAIEILIQLKDRSPKNINTLVNLGTAYVDASDFDKAREIFAEARKIDDQNEQTKEGEAKLAFQSGDIPLASQLVSELENGDELARYLNSIAISYVAMKDWEQAIQTYENAIKVLADKGKLHLLRFNLGLAYKKQSKKLEALSQFCESYIADPSYDRAYMAVAFIVQELRRSGVTKLPPLVAEVKRIRNERQAA